MAAALLIVSEIKHPLEEEPRLATRVRERLGLDSPVALEVEPQLISSRLEGLALAAAPMQR